VWAHANYVKSNPGSDARLAKSPSEVRVTFSETPDPTGSDIAVLLMPQGIRQNDARVTLAADEPNTLRVAVPELAEGGYLVSWTVLSAVDGHETKGAFGFAIGNAPLPEIPDVGPPTPPPAPLELIGRALSFMGIAVVLGLAFFALFVRPPVEERERRRERQLLIAGGALLIAGSALMIASYGAGIPGRLLLFLALRGAAGAVAIGALFLPQRLVPADARREVIAFAGLAAGLWATMVSHAAATGDPKYIALDFIHVVAISIWSGGVLAFALMAAPSVHDTRALGAMTWRFSLVALVSVAVLITTGTLQAFDRLVLWEDLYETPYGIALLAKIVLLVLLLGLGALNLLIWGPRLRRGLEQRAGLLRGVAVESTLFAAVFLAASFLTALAPPAQASGAAFDETQRVDGLRIEMLVAASNPGRNRYVVRVSEGLTPVTNAEAVLIRFTMVEHDMGIQELAATERAPGEYVAEGSPTAMFGTWKAETIVRIAGRLDTRALFTVPIANTGGQVAQVVTIPPYNMVVFADPTEPQAGAPVAINMVLIDAKGEPVSGKTVTATFSGPSTQAPLTAKEDSAKLGPGRYQIDLAGLEAGTWKVTIAVGSEGSGVYSLEVAR
jgi:copper transport protein